MAEGKSIAGKLVSPVFGLYNRVRLGFPGLCFQGAGGIGDDLMCSAIFRELKKRSSRAIVMASAHPELFAKNRDVDKLLYHPHPRWNRWLQSGLPLVRLGYVNYDAARDADEPPAEHIISKMCRTAGLNGEVELRPYLFLTPKELSAGKHAREQIVVQASGLSAAHPMRNKEWYPHRFQEVCAELSADVQVIQLGSEHDPKLERALDFRGKTSLRQTAAILANSLLFIGLAGGLMHLARAVDCRSVIIYGGREKPSQTGYVANKNLYSQVRCAPCWLRNPCDFDRKCMDMITVDQVVAAAAEQIAKFGSLLEVQTEVL
jgi:ADP-heptose:LPS heptosyltransferase